MKRSIHFTKVFGTLVLVSMILVIAVLPALAAPHQQTLHQVYVSDVRDVQFVVSWTTDVPTDGWVDFWPDGGTPPGTPVPDQINPAPSTTHYVLLDGLTPGTLYHFQVRSGAVTDNNGGAYYDVTTGPDIGGTPGRTVFGQMFDSTGTIPLENGIVYMQVQDNDGAGSTGNSQWVTSRTDSNGFWFYVLNNVRTADASAFFVMNDGTDNIRIVWQGGAAGATGDQPADIIILPLPATYPFDFGPTSLEMPPNAVTLTEFTVSGNSPANWLLIGGLALLFSAVVVLVLYRRMMAAK